MRSIMKSVFLKTWASTVLIGVGECVGDWHEFRRISDEKGVYED